MRRSNNGVTRWSALQLYSPNRVEHEFSEVAPTLVTLHTGHVDQRKAGPVGVPPWSLAVWEQGGSRFGALRTAVSTADGPSSRYPRSEPLAALFIPAKSPSFSGHPPLVGTKMGLNSPVPHNSAR